MLNSEQVEPPKELCRRCIHRYTMTCLRCRNGALSIEGKGWKYWSEQHQRHLENQRKNIEKFNNLKTRRQNEMR